MDATTKIIIGWLAFAATHILFSSVTLRPRLVAAMGVRGFLGSYSLVSLAIFIPLCSTYLSHLHEGARVLSLATIPGIHELAMVVAWVSFAMAIGGAAQPSALSLGAGETRARGMGRITRHPLFMSLAIWAFAHVLVNGFLTDLLFFGGFTLFGVIGCAHQDARKRATEGERLAAYFSETSLFPFAAILSGRNRLVLEELPWGGIAGGAVLATVIYIFHPALFG